MNSIILAFGLLSALQIILVLLALWTAKRYLERKQATLEARLEGALRDWLEPPEEGKPSKLALLVDSMGTVIGSAAARSIMSAMGAETAHTNRAANTASDLITAQQNPLLGILAGGKRGKGAAIQRLTELLMPLLQSRGNSNGGQASLFDVHKYG